MKAGTVVEDKHVVRKRSWFEWVALIEASPFHLSAVYEGDGERPSLPLDECVEEAQLTWHELGAER
ncbi:MAG: hypothetical protein KAY37_11430 [Phycisphaerae bacterium]|nr:hypothetical protein [Phycisphaerae bacterium]